MKKTVEKIGKQIGGQSFGVFSVSTTEPISNVYNNVKYYTIPTGFMNIYYMFLDGYFYATISQISINKIIDTNAKDKEEDLERFNRNFAYINDSQHVGFTVNFEELKSWMFQDLEEDFEIDEWKIINVYEDQVSYLREALTLSSSMDDFDGTLSNIESYYRNIPSDYLGGEFSVEDGKIYFSNNDLKREVSTIHNFANYWDTYEEFSPDLLEMVSVGVSTEEIKQKLASYKTGGLAMSFTEEGLDVRISFGNPKADYLDERFSYESDQNKLGTFSKKQIYLAVGAIVVLSSLAVLVIIKRKKRTESNSLDS